MKPKRHRHYWLGAFRLVMCWHCCKRIVWTGKCYRKAKKRKGIWI